MLRWLDRSLRTDNSSQTVGRCGKRAAQCVTVLTATLLGPVPALGAVFAPGFEGPQLDTGLEVSASPGTSYTVGGGRLVLDTAAIQSDERITVGTTFQVAGDFIATVTASGTALGRADLGLMLGTPDWSPVIADVFLNGGSHTVNGNIFEPAFSGKFLAAPSDTLTLSIKRIGDTITEFFDGANGQPIVVNSVTSPVLATPVQVGLFLAEIPRLITTNEGTFTDFEVLSPTNAPEPASSGMVGIGILGLGAIRMVTRRSVK